MSSPNAPSSPVAFQIKPLYAQLDDCLSADKFPLKRRIQQFTKQLNSGEKVKDEKVKDSNQTDASTDSPQSKLATRYEKLVNDIQASKDKRAFRLKNLPEVTYPPLPVSDKKRRY